MIRTRLMFAGLLGSGLATVLTLHNGDLGRTAVAAGLLLFCAIRLGWDR